MAEHGAQRNFEPWREQQEKDEVDKLARLEEEEANPMAALENRTVDSKREMDILDKLQEIRTRNARMERADAEKVLESISSRVDVGDVDGVESLKDEERRRQEEEDEAEVRRVFGKVHGEVLDIEIDGLDVEGDADEDGTEAPEASGSGAAPKPVNRPASKPAPSVKRKLDQVEPDARDLLSEEQRKIAAVDFKSVPVPKKKQANALAAKLGIKVVAKSKTKA